MKPANLHFFHGLQKPKISIASRNVLAPIQVIVNDSGYPISTPLREDMPEGSRDAGKISDEPLWRDDESVT